MDSSKSDLQERNRELGRILQEARLQKDTPLTACARLIHTSRKRYKEMEEGASPIGAAELEVLMRYLDIPRLKIWPGESADALSPPVILEAAPGEMLHVIIQVRK